MQQKYKILPATTRMIGTQLLFFFRLQLLKEPTTKNVRLIERSIQNNRFCFLELAKRLGDIKGEELEVLYSW